MLSVYRAWKNRKVVYLAYAGRSWEVALNRDKKKCRFGRGWNRFTKENNFYAGRTLKFAYAGKLIIQVSLL